MKVKNLIPALVLAGLGFTPAVPGAASAPDKYAALESFTVPGTALELTQARTVAESAAKSSPFVWYEGLIPAPFPDMPIIKVRAIPKTLPVSNAGIRSRREQGIKLLAPYRRPRLRRIGEFPRIAGVRRFGEQDDFKGIAEKTPTN